MDEHIMLDNTLNLEPPCQLKKEADPSKDIEGIASENSKPEGSVTSTWPAPHIERLNLLIVEDNAAILKNAKRIFSTLSLPFSLHVRYAGTLLSAQKHLKDADALICDFYFPRHSEGVREALAKPLIQTALGSSNCRCGQHARPAAPASSVFEAKLEGFEELSLPSEHTGY